jgi:hypothetical protein
MPAEPLQGRFACFVTPRQVDLDDLWSLEQQQVIKIQ